MNLTASNSTSKLLGVIFFMIFGTSLLYTVIQDKENDQEINDCEIFNINTSGLNKCNNFVKIVTVSCGTKHFNDTVALINSAIIFTSRKLEFYIITEEAHQIDLIEKFESLPVSERQKFTYQFREPYFSSDDGIQWKQLYRDCASERIFIADMFNSTDAMLYIDADAVFLDDVAKLWNKLKQFDEQQIVAFAYDLYTDKSGSFGYFSKTPFYGLRGINAGIMLMNLTRIREFKMFEKLVAVYKKYEKYLVYGEQDLLNALFNQYPDRVYDLDCSWNFYGTYCFDDLNCWPAEKNGIRILHGLGNSFHHSWAGEEIKFIHEVFEKFEFPGSYAQIYVDIKNEFTKRSGFGCPTIAQAFLKPLKKLETM